MNSLATRARRYNQIPSRWRPLIDLEDYVLLFSLDFGTSSSAIYYAIIHKGNPDPSKIKVNRLDIHQNKPELPTQVAVLPVDQSTSRSKFKRGKLIFGLEVDDALTAGTITNEDVFRNIKQSDCFVRLDDDMPDNEKRNFADLHGRHEGALQSVNNKYEQLVFEHRWVGRMRIVKLKTMKDVVELFLEFFLMEVKSAIDADSGGAIGPELLEELFEGKKDTDFGDKIRLGVAIPELWQWQRLELYKRLMDAGYPERLDLLCEGRCALAMILKMRLDELGSEDSPTRNKLLHALVNTTFVGVDQGGETLDIAIMKIVMQGSIVRLRAIGESSSTRHGGERANDTFRSLIPEFFGGQLSAVLKFLKVSQGVLEENLTRGFEQAKCAWGPDDKTSKVAVLYKGDGVLPQGDNGDISWSGKQLKIPRAQFRQCIANPIAAVLDKKGPSRKVFEQAVVLADDGAVEIMSSGGGSKSRLYRNELGKKFKNAPSSYYGSDTASWVAQGGCLILADPAICNAPKISKKSLGIIVTVEFDLTDSVHALRQNEAVAMTAHLTTKDITAKHELPNTVLWQSTMNHQVESEPVRKFMQQTIFPHNDGLEDPYDSKEGWELAVPIAESDHQVKSQVDGYSSNDPDIHECDPLVIPINKAKAAWYGGQGSLYHHGFQLGADNRWRLDFYYALTLHRKGMLWYVEVSIPKHSSIVKGKISEKADLDVFEFERDGELKTAADIFDDESMDIDG